MQRSTAHRSSLCGCKKASGKTYGKVLFHSPFVIMTASWVKTPRNPERSAVVEVEWTSVVGTRAHEMC